MFGRKKSKDLKDKELSNGGPIPQPSTSNYSTIVPPPPLNFHNNVQQPNFPNNNNNNNNNNFTQHQSISDRPGMQGMQGAPRAFPNNNNPFVNATKPSFNLPPPPSSLPPTPPTPTRNQIPMTRHQR